MTARKGPRVAPPLPVTLAAIEAAAEGFAGAIQRTPTIAAAALSAMTGAEIVLKLEILNPTGSFKERGALNKLNTLTPRQRAAGVIAMSAGNHAQGLAFHARRLGIACTIVMPEATPFTKIEGTQALGADVILRGAGLPEAARAAAAIGAERGLTMVHPYDDPAVIAGQGTIALELVAEHPDLDAILVPIGGGGLAAGIAVAAKALSPHTRIIGVQSTLYPAMQRAIAGLDSGPPPAIGSGTTIAEGIAVKEPGVMTRAIIAALVPEIMLVEESALERAVDLLANRQKLVVEGAGAAGLAALLRFPERFRGRKVAIILCGGNIDSRLLSSILMRGLVHGGKLVRLRVELSDSPGTLAKIAHVIGAGGGNIVEIYHHRLFHDVPVKEAEVDLVIETRNPDHVAAIIEALDGAGFPTRQLSRVD